MQKFLSAPAVRDLGLVALSAVLALLLLAGIAQAATTITTNINTGGDLTVSGSSTIGDAVTDAVTANAYFTQMRIGTGSTFDIIGTVGADELGVEGAMEVDGTATFSGLASTSSIKVGDEPAPTVINGIVAGTCTFQSVAVVASSSAFAICAPTTSGSLQSGDYVMVMATSSLALRFQIHSASSTADAMISVQVTNSNWPVGQSTATGVNTVQFWAWR